MGLENFTLDEIRQLVEDAIECNGSFFEAMLKRNAFSTAELTIVKELADKAGLSIKDYVDRKIACHLLHEIMEEMRTN